MKDRNHNSRRQFINSVGLLGVASMLPLPSVFGAEPEKEQEPGGIMKCKPYLQPTGRNEMTVRWITSLPSYSYVEYGEDPANLNNKIQQLKNGLIQANNKVHSFSLKNLSPGKTYYYKAISKVIADFDPYDLSYGQTGESEIHSFSIPDEKEEAIEFLVFNDTHERPETYEVLSAFAGNSEKDFIFLNGDMFDWQVDEDQIVEKLLKPLDQYFGTSKTPFLLGRGNHETRGEFARQLPEYFDGITRDYYYSFQLGPVYFIVLDSGEDKLDSDPEYAGLVNFDEYRLEQQAWLEKEIKKREFRRAKYKVVFSHIPFYYSGNWHGTLHCRELWGPLLNKAKVDVLISGHTHKYGIHPPVKDQHEYPIVIGGGKKDGTRTLMRIKADKKEFNLEMIDDSGNTVGSLVL